MAKTCIRKMVRRTQLCKDHRRRNVSHAQLSWIGRDIPKGIITFTQFQSWFSRMFCVGRWSIIKITRHSKKRIALFRMVYKSGKYQFYGDFGSLKRKLTWRKKKLES